MAAVVLGSLRARFLEELLDWLKKKPISVLYPGSIGICLTDLPWCIADIGNSQAHNQTTIDH